MGKAPSLKNIMDSLERSGFTSAGLADDHLDRQYTALFHWLLLDQADELADGRPADLLDGGVHGGQRWDEDAGEKGIVEPDHGYIFGYFQSGFPQSLDDANGIVIIAGENGIKFHLGLN